MHGARNRKRHRCINFIFSLSKMGLLPLKLGYYKKTSTGSTPSGTGLQVVLATKRSAPKEVVAHAPKRFFLFFPLMPLINCSD